MPTFATVVYLKCESIKLWSHGRGRGAAGGVSSLSHRFLAVFDVGVSVIRDWILTAVTLAVFVVWDCRVKLD